ncbi:DNA-directed DNA polymerase [Tanacetum coccineum]
MENANPSSFTLNSEFLDPKKKLEIESWLEDSKIVDPLVSSDDVEYFDTFPTLEELGYHEWLLKYPKPSWVKAKIRTRNLNNIKISCMIGHFLKRQAYINLESPINVMSKHHYKWIMSKGLESRHKPSNPSKNNNFVGRVRGLKVFVGNFTKFFKESKKKIFSETGDDVRIYPDGVEDSSIDSESKPEESSRIMAGRSTRSNTANITNPPSETTDEVAQQLNTALPNLLTQLVQALRGNRANQREESARNKKRSNDQNQNRGRDDRNKRQRTGRNFAIAASDQGQVQPGKATNERPKPTCFECGDPNHFRRNCPRMNRATTSGGNRPNPMLVIAGNLNQGNNKNRAHGRAFALGVVVDSQDPNVVTGTFSLNDRFMTVLFDSGVDYSFISTSFLPLINMKPSVISLGYEIEIANGLKVVNNMIVRGMDWLSKLRAKIVCFEKIVQIPLSNGENLEVHRERLEGNLKQLKTMKVNEPKLEDIPVVHEFPGVFLEDLSGLPPSRKVEFSIDLIPGAVPVAKSPYRLAPTEMQELSIQLKELQEKGIESRLHPYHFIYPERSLTMEEMLNKFIDKGKREHEEMRAFIYDFQTTNELLFKERSNLLIELRFGVQALLNVINNVAMIDCDVKGVIARGEKTTTQDVHDNNTNVLPKEPLVIELEKPIGSNEVLTNDQPQMTSEPVVQPSNEVQTPPVPFPRRLRKEKEEAQQKKFLENLKQLHINLPFIEALAQMPKYAKFLKGLLTNKARLEEACKITMNERCSAVLLNKLPSKEKDPGSFTIPCDIGQLHIDNALADLGASISLMPYTMYKKLGLGEPKATRMSLELADRSIQYPRGIIKNVLIKVDKFILPIDFVILDMPEDSRVPIILGRPFLATARAMIDVFNKKITLRGTTKRNDVKREHLYSANANEIDEKKPELKNLPQHLEYAYLHGDKSFPIIISSELSEKEKISLLQVLEKRKGSITWKMLDIKEISPSYCTHKILMEDDYKPVIQPERRLNPKVQDVVKNKFVKLLDSWLIYLISDSSWVSPIHIVPKKGRDDCSFKG